MQRRTFMNMAAGFTTALVFEPLGFGAEQEQKHPVLYPDPAVEVIDPRFAKYKVANGPSSAYIPARDGRKGLCGSVMGVICCSVTSLTTVCCVGRRRLERPAFSAVRLTTAMAISATGRAGCLLVSTTRAG